MNRSFLFLLLALIATGCDDSTSPTEPTPPQMTTANIVFTNPEALADHRDAITQLIQETYDQANGALAIGAVQITVTADASRAIPGYGIGGFALGPGEIEIVVSPTFPGLAQILADRIPPTVAHELHHVARIRGPGYGMTLLETLVSEGMADVFAVELLGTPLQPWSDAFPESDNARFLSRARAEFDSSTFDFNAWFLAGGFGLPRWTGYTLGFRIVRAYQADNPGRTAAQLVNTPAEDFRPAGAI